MLWGGLGVTAGAHRLWTHRSYKATLPMRIFLMIGQSISGQYSIYGWATGHRTHHKFADTDADPHNVKRGFCFAHVGWIIQKEHPLCAIKSKGLNGSDLIDDFIVRWQHRFYEFWLVLIGTVLPTLIPCIFKGSR